MRTWLPVLLAALLLVLAAGCGGDDDEGATPAGTTTTEETTTAPATTEDGATTEAGGDTGSADAGEQVFASAGCGGCHTLQAAGASGNVGPNLDDAKPDFELVVDRVTNGQGAMPSFSGQLSEQQIRDVAAYVSENAGED